MKRIALLAVQRPAGSSLLALWNQALHSITLPAVELTDDVSPAAAFLDVLRQWAPRADFVHFTDNQLVPLAANQVTVDGEAVWVVGYGLWTKEAIPWEAFRSSHRDLYWAVESELTSSYYNPVFKDIQRSMLQGLAHWNS